MKDIFTKIVGWMNKIGADKYKHFTLGSVIATAIIMALALFVPKWAAIAASVVTVAVAAIGKEKVDDKADLREIVATLCGGAVVWLPFLIAILIV